MNRVDKFFTKLIGSTDSWVLGMLMILVAIIISPFYFIYWLITEPFILIYNWIRDKIKYHKYFKATVSKEPYNSSDLSKKQADMMDDNTDDNN